MLPRNGRFATPFCRKPITLTAIRLWPELPHSFRNFSQIAGVDEVGRGPLAGPVVAAAVILPEGFDFEAPVFARLGDSKSVPAMHRREIAAALLHVAQIGIAYVPAPVIDRLNIRRASLLAMERAIAALPNPAQAALIDGRDIPPGIKIPAIAIIKGDAKVAAISAASIIAKVARDRMMAEADMLYPAYGFEKHSGYPTLKHRNALVEHGLCPLHRRSFGPCRPESV